MSYGDNFLEGPGLSDSIENIVKAAGSRKKRAKDPDADLLAQLLMDSDDDDDDEEDFTATFI